MIDTSKVIHAPVGGGRYTVTAPIVKEDYGLYLKIEGLELPTTYEVDFSNSEHNGTSVTMIGNSDGVLIPSQFISSGKDVFAFLYHVGVDFGRTVYKFRIPNKLRPDRTEETPTPTQQSVIDQAISALNSAVEQTAQDVIDADASAQSASESAEQAQESARTAGLYSDTAQTYANSAEISANSASASATASAQSAQTAEQIKDDVEGMVDDAQASASASAQSATASANSASQASGYVTSASQSASSAQGYASQAQTSAQSASAKASEASTSASTASAKASESAQSASQALTYKTDAESAKTSAQTAQGLAESARDSAVSAKDDAEDARDEAQALVDEISGKVEQIDQNTADIASLEDDRFKPYAVDTASGAIASFSDGADDIPLKSLVIDINPVQDLHGQDAPYPAGGGVNKFDVSTELTGYKLGSGTGVLEQSANYCTSDFIPVSANTDYYFLNVARGVEAVCVGWYDSNKEFIATNTMGGGSDHKTSGIKTSPSNASYARIVHYVGIENVALNYPSTATAWSPYENICPISGWTEIDVNHSDADMTNPTTLTIQLGQTVYGGKLDVLSGELVIDRYFVDPSQWTRYNASNGYIAYRIINIPYGRYGNDTMNMPLSNMIAKFGGFSSSAMSENIIQPPRISTNTAYLALQDGIDPTTVELSYLIANPLTVQLSANQLNSLYGQNNLWADSGDTTAVYRADTKLFIERLTAPDSADMIADANITSGKYFMVGNSLYKATANIANGGQITVGTNCTRVSLAQALNEINS